MTEYTVSLTLDDLCQQLHLNRKLCIDLVDYGIVSPGGQRPSEWSFDLNMVCTIQRAIRLHSDLELDWADVAIVAELIEERDRLRAENQLLRQQLARFLDDPLID